jgi:hypothetical protein
MALTTVKNSGLSGSIDLTSKVTGTLPVANGGTALTSGFVNGSTALNEADQWRLSTDYSNASNGVNEVLTSNWERNDTDFAKIGTGLTQSSGVFSFPSTGIYLIQCQSFISASSATSAAHLTILLTTDDGTYNGRAYVQVGCDTNRGDAMMCQTIFDVTSTSNCKFKIQTNGGTYITWHGHSSNNQTTVTVARLGDT